MNRREYLTLCTTTATLGSAGCLGDQWEGSSDTASSISEGPSVGVDRIADGLTQPLAIEFPRDRDFRYVADKFGKIYFLGSDGVREDPFLDISDQLVSPLTNYEQGLLGLALHPNYVQNRKFYVRYSAPLREDAPSDFSHTFVLSEFRADEDLRRADPDSERIVLEITQPGPAHQAGSIVFGPDDFLYVGVGDGASTKDSVFGGFGDAGPGHPQDWYLANKGGNGQDLTDNLLGSILRIDVDNTENGKQYAVPDDNPLVGKDGLDEQFAWGFRNPYRMSFDEGRLFVGDVGVTAFEEINIVEKGGNYGWNVKEGHHCFNGNSAFRNGLKDDAPGFLEGAFGRMPLQLLNLLAVRFLRMDDLPVCPTETPRGNPLIDPVAVYPHEQNGQSVGRAVIGGHVYRGSAVEQLRGKYVFGDMAGERSGRIFITEQQEERPWPMKEVLIPENENNMINEIILSFGQDHDGEMYVLTSEFSEGTGKVYRITPP